jgi:SpoVK/Ycf46/Vps4 family AAA+-type ATPase
MINSILGSREKSGEHEAMRKIKNEFMSMWDGLKTKENERVIVMAATNRPFDLDDAVLRRMPRRLLVDLPDADNRYAFYTHRPDMHAHADMMHAK